MPVCCKVHALCQVSPSWAMCFPLWEHSMGSRFGDNRSAHGVHMGFAGGKHYLNEREACRTTMFCGCKAM